MSIWDLRGSAVFPFWSKLELCIFGIFGILLAYCWYIAVQQCHWPLMECIVNLCGLSIMLLSIHTAINHINHTAHPIYQCSALYWYIHWFRAATGTLTNIDKKEKIKYWPIYWPRGIISTNLQAWLVFFLLCPSTCFESLPQGLQETSEPLGLKFLRVFGQVSPWVRNDPLRWAPEVNLRAPEPLRID